MPQPRRPKSSARSSAPSAPHDSDALTPEELASLAQFDLIESALDEFPPPPELATRRELQAAKNARRSAPRATPNDASQTVGAHYFASSPPLKPGAGKEVRVQVAGADIVLRGGAGTFSKSELDQGTEILIQTFVRSPAFSAKSSPHWCDLGCGWGAVAAVLATLKPRAKLWACDINRRAAALALANARGLELANVAVWNGNSLGACRSFYFDAMLCNPPIRAGNRAIEAMFEEARRGLKSNGEMWVVLRTAQGAKSWQKKLEAQFGSCDTMQISHGYRVLRARKASDSSSRPTPEAASE